MRKKLPPIWDKFDKVIKAATKVAMLERLGMAFGDVKRKGKLVEGDAK
jgi:hypothetical protein